MEERPIKVLLVESDREYVDVLRNGLVDARTSDIEVEWASELTEALSRLSQGGIVPSYTMIVRAFFPAGDAGWRIGTVLLFTVFGMALGAWLAGALYDLTGSYTAAFVNALAFNVVNMAIAGFLLRRARS